MIHTSGDSTCSDHALDALEMVLRFVPTEGGPPVPRFTPA